jgi:hypothetical protein
LAYPAIALALSGLWNIHYVLAAKRHGGSGSQTGTAVGNVLVVAFSFLVFAPALWTLIHLSKSTGVIQSSDDALPENLAMWGKAMHNGFPLAAGGALGMQYLVDILLLLLLAWLFSRFEASRET